MKIAILGSGVMGRRLAVLCALKQHDVRLWNHNPIVDFHTTFRRKAMMEARVGGFDRHSVAPAMERIVCTDNLDDLADAELVLEAVAENIDIKIELIRQVEQRISEKTVIASNTSAISLEKIGTALDRPDRFLGLHFFNSPLYIPLVEVVTPSQTAKAATDTALKFVRDLGSEPLKVPDFPGLIVNRLLFVMLVEAIKMVESGQFTIKDIDTAMRLGASHPMGPLQLADYIGLDVCVYIMRELAERTGEDKFLPPDTLLKLVAEGKLGKKTGSGFYDG